jgi:hypothetical protein
MPFLALAGLIAYLLTSNRQLKEQLERERLSRDVKATLALKEEAKNEADKLDADWEHVRTKYVNSDGSESDV